SVFNDDGKWLFSDCDPDGKERPYGPANWYPIACRAVPEERLDGVFAVMDLLKSEYGYRLYYPAIGEPPIDKVGRCASGDVPAYMGENGNAYNQGSHGYLARALAIAGRGDELFDVMKWMLPCYQEKHPTYAALAAPYAIVNCWQELPSFKHRAMLSFLTGSVAMCVRGAYEWMGGVEPIVGGIEIDPCIPDDWNEMSLSLSYKGRQLNISIKRTGAEKLTVNGTEVIKSAPTDNRYNGFYSVPDSMLGTAENALMIEI
ncbi:MAG: glycosyl hydrolase family 65 protein, partial [Acutalibacteraceae bacterium]